MDYRNVKRELKHVISDSIVNDTTAFFVLADIDYFTNISGKIGMLEGDAVVKRLVEFWRENSVYFGGRCGVDEFYFLFRNIKEDEVLTEVNHIRMQTRRHFFVSPNSTYAKVPITVSFGIASYNEDMDEDALIKSAEIALAMAKKKGRNRVEVAPDFDSKYIHDSSSVAYTLVGQGLRGYSGDGEDAYRASICEPYGVDIGTDGTIYFADRGNHVIRAIYPSGIIDTVAGCGVPGYDGDGQEALHAKLNKPSGIACGRDGYIYIADTGNHCIRRIDGNNVITTIAGNGKQGGGLVSGHSWDACMVRPGGVAVDINGNVYTNDYGNDRVLRFNQDDTYQQITKSDAYLYINGEKVNFPISKPYGVAVSKDGKKVYIADYGNKCIRVVDVETEINYVLVDVSTLGKNAEVYWVAITERVLCIADAGNHCIWICDIASGRVKTTIGTGKVGYKDALEDIGEVCFNIPAGIAIDEHKEMIYVADYANNAIRVINVEGML